jgi:hypothetical protein
MSVSLTSQFNQHQLNLLTSNDRKELRNFGRFLALWPKHKDRMLKRERWQKYLRIGEYYDHT